MPPTQSQTSWGDLPIGMKALQTAETLPQVYLQLRERGLVPLAVERKARKRLEAVARVLSPTSTSRTNLVSLWLTTRPQLYAEVVCSPEAERRAAVTRHIIAGVRDRVAQQEEAPNREVEVNEEVEGGDGGIGIR